MGPRTFEPLGVLQIESYRGTQCVTLSAAVCLDLHNSNRFKSSRGHKFRRSGVSQSDGFVTGGGRRGPAQAGGNLTNGLVSRQIRAPSRADVADVRPCIPDHPPRTLHLQVQRPVSAVGVSKPDV